MEGHNDTSKWLKENQKFFLPPVCNKMMHNDQLKVFYVGGPNQRKDFHLEEGEELFFMRRGKMELPILSRGRFTTIVIREGDVFLLPGKVPHSPQRWSDTVGLVVERDRTPDEMDGLRYFVEDSQEILFDRWFFCEDLGSQLGPVIKEFFSSAECRSGRPGPGTRVSDPVWEPDSKVEVEQPFNLQEWLTDHRSLIQKSGSVPLFDPRRYQSDIMVLGRGEGTRTLTRSGSVETWLWQLEGSCTITLGARVVKLVEDQTLLVPPCVSLVYSPDLGSVTLSVVMDPVNKERPVNNKD